MDVPDGCDEAASGDGDCVANADPTQVNMMITSIANTTIQNHTYYIHVFMRLITSNDMTVAITATTHILMLSMMIVGVDVCSYDCYE